MTATASRAPAPPQGLEMPAERPCRRRHLRFRHRRDAGAWRRLSSPLRALLRLSDLLAVWERRARDRRMLAAMSDHMLKDLGIARCEAIREASKPFWRI